MPRYFISLGIKRHSINVTSDELWGLGGIPYYHPFLYILRLAIKPELVRNVKAKGRHKSTCLLLYDFTALKSLQLSFNGNKNTDESAH
jgi:hypothetical protein